MTRAVRIGAVTVGGGAPVAIQSMLSARSDDVAENVAQAKRLEAAGCEILRVSVPDLEALRLIPAIKEAISAPLVADIHFDYRLAVESVNAGADKIRINPGNLGGDDRLRAVVDACRLKNIPLRVGVNSGSLEKDLLQRFGGPTAEALAESALRNIARIEAMDYNNMVISVKSSDVAVFVAANRLLAQRCDYPLHLGVTEAGAGLAGIVKSSVGIGALLLDGTGDTLRVSLTGDPENEIDAARAVLKASGRLRQGVELISCPTCGRTRIDIEAIARKVAEGTRHITAPLRVAVMGCAVNGPGEASGADVGIAGGDGDAVLFRKGKIIGKVEGDIAARLIEEVEKIQEETHE